MKIIFILKMKLKLKLKLKGYLYMFTCHNFDVNNNYVNY